MAADVDLDPHGKLLWDVVKLRLDAQSANQTALVGRAKDVLGLTTIASTITGVILSDKFFPIVKAEPPAWWIVAAFVALALVYFPGIWAIRPQEYSFAPDATAFSAIEADHPEASEGQMYRSLADGYLLTGTDGKSRILKNQLQLETLSRLVVVEMIGVSAIGVLAAILAFFIHVDAAAAATTGA